MADSRIRRKVVTVDGEITMTLNKPGVVKGWVASWVEETLMAQAKKEGWGHLLGVKVSKVKLEYSDG